MTEQIIGIVLMIISFAIFAGGILWLNNEFTKIEREKRKEGN